MERRYLIPLFILGLVISIAATVHLSVTNQHGDRTEVLPLLTIETQGEAVRNRGDLVKFVWGQPSLPGGGPSSITRDISWPPPEINVSQGPTHVDSVHVLPAPYNDIVPNGSYLSAVDRYNHSMPYGVNSKMYVFHPNKTVDRNALTIFHSGHGPDAVSWRGIRHLLERGYTVLTVSMPLMGGNQPGRFQGEPLLLHVDFQRIVDADRDNVSFHPMQYFFEPVAVALNDLTERESFDYIMMIGTSGGAWTTTLYAAMDTRIDASLGGFTYPDIRADRGRQPETWEGKYFYARSPVSYADAYVLASYPRRIHVQFRTAGGAYTRHRVWEPRMKQRVRRVGGRFDVVYDSTTTHAVSEYAVGFLEGFVEGSATE